MAWWYGLLVMGVEAEVERWVWGLKPLVDKEAWRAHLGWVA